MRDNYKVFDADTHVSVSAEQLTPYLSPRVKELVPDLESHLNPIRIGHAGEVYEAPFRHRYKFVDVTAGWSRGRTRVLGDAEPSDQPREFQAFMGSRLPTHGGNEYADVRIKDMDEEGTDVHTMVPNGVNGAENPEVELEFIRAQHRWLSDFCTPYPSRLKSFIVASARSVEDSVTEIKQWGSSDWAVGVQVFAPVDYPLDHPDLAPIFRAAETEGLTIVHHSASTGYPGYRDMWDNPFLGRSASHPWGAARFVGAVIGSAMFDKYPELNFAILESGFGWLPHWSIRMDDQMNYVGYVAKDLKLKPSEYIQSGRFFCSIEMHEGASMVKMFVEQLGEDILMLGSDYPHAESRFPDSVDRVLSWSDEGVSKPILEKLLWTNPVACFGSP